jgi:hypothetical protein
VELEGQLARQQHVRGLRDDAERHDPYVEEQGPVVIVISFVIILRENSYTNLLTWGFTTCYSCGGFLTPARGAIFRLFGSGLPDGIFSNHILHF